MRNRYIFTDLFFTLACFFSKSTQVQSWNLTLEASGEQFFDHFTFITEDDPTHGYVNFVDYPTALANGYINTSESGDTYIGCDYERIATGRGRDSIRIETVRVFNSGLFILYLSHMPFGCGSWPAFWTVGPNWPNSGEIDVIEGVNQQSYDVTTLHTGTHCDFANTTRNLTGFVISSNCDVYDTPAGCTVASDNPNAYGGNFNSVGGGVYAVEWTSAGIKSWFWNEGHIPSDVLENDPKPDTWSVPYAAFPFGTFCSPDSFQNQKVVFDLTFCGDWAGIVFSNDCPGKGTCNDYVKDNPEAFKESYWNIHWLKVFN